MKEDFTGAEVDGLVTFKASYEAQTKTVLNGLTPYWTPSDKISIYDGQNNEFVSTATEESATTSFKGVLAGKGRKHYLAAYPYNENLSFSFMGMSIYGLQVPKEQTAVENSYDPSALVSVAYTLDSNLAFKNVCSLVKFTVVSDGVTSVTLVPTEDTELLSGEFNVTIDTEPRYTYIKCENTVTLKGDFKKDATYYIVTLPATLEKGFSVILNGNIRSLTADYPVNLARSGLVNLGSLSLNPGESQLPGGDEDQDDAVPSGWVIIGQFCDWLDEGALATYDLGNYYKAFDVPAASLSSFKFKNGDVWVGLGGDAVAADKWISLSQDAGATDISFTGSAALYDVYLDKDLRAFYVTAAGGSAPDPIPAPFVGKSVAGNFNEWNSAANPMESEGEYYVVKGLQLASTNLADPTSNGFKFVDVKSTEESVWYGVGAASVELGVWYKTMVDGSQNICINGDATALYDAYVAKDMTTFCVVAAGSELPEYTPAPEPELPTVLYLKPGDWNSDAPRFEAYFFGAGDAWVTMTDNDKDGVFEASVPEGMTNVIFVRMDPNKAEHSWDSKWNQTVDLSITPGLNCFVFDSWGNEETQNNSTGTWTSYTPSSTPTPDPTPDPTPEPDPTPDPTPVADMLYLKPNSNWKDGGACFEAYFFNGNSYVWVSMTDADGDGFYECEKQAGYPNVIFTRMNPNASQHAWESKWDQTVDLTIPTDGKNCFTVKEGDWNNATGTWSTK